MDPDDFTCEASEEFWFQPPAPWGAAFGGGCCWWCCCHCCCCHCWEYSSIRIVLSLREGISEYLPLLILLLILLILLPILSRAVSRLTIAGASPRVRAAALVAISSAWKREMQKVTWEWVIDQMAYPQHCLRLAYRRDLEHVHRLHIVRLHSDHPWSCSRPQRPWWASPPGRTCRSCWSWRSAAPPRCWTGWSRTPCWTHSRQEQLGRRSLVMLRKRFSRSE